MSDLLLILSVLFALAAAIVALVEIARLRPPRTGAILLVAALVALVLGAWLDPTSFRVQDVPTAFDRLFSSRIAL